MLPLIISWWRGCLLLLLILHICVQPGVPQEGGKRGVETEGPIFPDIVHARTDLHISASLGPALQ